MQFKRSQPPCCSTPERGARALPGVSCVETPGAPRVRAAREARTGPSPNAGHENTEEVDSVACETVFGDRQLHSQTVVRASRGSAAPGSQSVVLLGAAPADHGRSQAGGSQNARMPIAPNDLPSQGPVAIAAAADECTSITLRAARANPAFKRTAYGRRLTPR